MDRVFEEDGVTYTKKYQSMLDDACRKYDRSFFEGKLQEADTYFEEAAKRGWPSIKSFQDLQVECHTVPFIKRCLNQLNTMSNGS